MKKPDQGVIGAVFPACRDAEPSNYRVLRYWFRLSSSQSAVISTGNPQQQHPELMPLLRMAVLHRQAALTVPFPSCSLFPPGEGARAGAFPLLLRFVCGMGVSISQKRDFSQIRDSRDKKSD